MNPRQALLIFALVGLIAGTPAAQRRPYDVVMKDVASTYGSLRKHLDAGNTTAVATDAGKLERLFKDVEDFWAPFKTKDAIEAARGAREASIAIAAAARDNTVQKATSAAAGLGRFCTTCHNSHREQLPDKTYRIKP